ncbi:MAG: FAD/NAD(P)-binding protein [Caulobacteraceae bacterium]|nr:FAD/NAD(P)-binding protein [Caulobacteraceae bacterium]
MDKRVVVIVGGGFSGSLLALHLLRTNGGPRVFLVEKGPAFGRGAAFSTRQLGHLLNVRAGNMSAYPDQPDHFQAWLAERTGQSADAFAFAPRWVYGDYLQGELRAAAQSDLAAGRLTLVQDEAVEAVRSGGAFKVRLAMGRALAADVVVIATGHGAPTEAVSSQARFAADPHYIRNPWAQDALARIQPDEDVLLLGTSLTAVDLAVSLDGRGHRGRILALSRRGLLSQRHARFDGEPLSWSPSPGEPLSRQLRRFRREADRLANWRRAFDGLREQTQAMWKGLSETERRRFLRHLRPWWDIHRHRMAPETAARIDAQLANGRLRTVAGRLIALRAEIGGVTVTWRPRGESSLRADRVQWVINCTGAEGDPRRSSNPLIRRLLESGLARPDALDLGLDVDEQGRLIGRDGAATDGLYGIGPITRGALWEIVAVPDIRLQAQRLAAAIAGPAAARAKSNARPSPKTYLHRKIVGL